MKMGFSLLNQLAEAPRPDLPTAPFTPRDVQRLEAGQHLGIISMTCAKHHCNVKKTKEKIREKL